MDIQIEFYGIPRHRAGLDKVSIKTNGESASLGDVIIKLADQFPGLAEVCFEGNRLRDGFIANLDGEQFVNDPSFVFPSGSPLLIMSADAGG